MKACSVILLTCVTYRVFSQNAALTVILHNAEIDEEIRLLKGCAT